MNYRVEGKRSISQEVVTEYERILHEKPPEPRQRIRATEEKMRKGFPPADSVQVRHTRVTW